MSIADKREMMEMSRRLIPAMDEIELASLALTYQNIIEHMIERGAVKVEDET